MASLAWPGPRRSVEALADRVGHDVVIRACVDLVEGRDVDGHIIHALGGPPARLAIGGARPEPGYWARVWGLRGLLWLWADSATPAVVQALADDAWRVREMAAKVAGRQLVDEALEALLLLRDDPVARVRAAGAKAIQKISVGGG